MTSSPDSSDLKINRELVGTIALVMLVGAGILWFFTGSQNVWTGACLKIGSVMAAFWLALPNIPRHSSLGQVSFIELVGFMVLALVLIGKRVDLKIAIPLLFAIAITTLVLRPKSKTRSK